MVNLAREVKSMQNMLNADLTPPRCKQWDSRHTRERVKSALRSFNSDFTSRAGQIAVT